MLTKNTPLTIESLMNRDKQKKEVIIKLFDKQYDILNFKTQYGMAIAGVQSGKTFTGSCWTHKKINEFPTKNGLIVAPTYKILQQATLDKFFTVFPEYRKFYKEQKGIIDLPTGGIVYIRSADQPLGIEGMTAHWVWCDEGGQMSRLAWTILRSRVAMTRGQVLITTTPYTLNWLYEDFYLAWERKLFDDLTVVTWKSTDNPFFPKEHFENERRRLTPEEFSRRYEGTFTKMEGLVYNLDEEHIEPEKSLNVKDCILGVDFGYKNPTAIVVIKVDNDNNYHIVDEWVETGKIQDEVEQKILELKRKYSFSYIYADPAEPDRIESMRRRGFYVRDVDKNVVLGIDRVREIIKLGKLYVFNTCKNVLDEFKMYHYDPDKQLDTPVKESDHCMDALRYAIYNYEGVSRIEYKVYGGVKPYYENMY